MEYVENDLVRIAKRENNNKRNYLIVNPLQGKHIPVAPSKALELFSNLAKTLEDEYSGERLLVIGFAETATAIGAGVAILLNAKYIQTTREDIADVEYLFFSEEHSHATEQKLVKNDIDGIINDIDRIIFVEDELSTGKTIVNIISIIEKEYSKDLKFSVVSILNGMPKENIDSYKRKNINLHYLLKTNHETYSEIAEEALENGNYYECISKTPKDIFKLDIGDYKNPRRLVEADEYRAACDKLWKSIKEEIGIIFKKQVLVIGTEECMFPALYVGEQIEKMGNKVLCHSTTRSPITVSLDREYPLHSRYELKSLYDSKRRVFLYNIGEFDKVFIITDAVGGVEEGLNSLVNALQVHNNNITLIRWC